MEFILKPADITGGITLRTGWVAVMEPFAWFNQPHHSSLSKLFSMDLKMCDTQNPRDGDRERETERETSNHKANMFLPFGWLYPIAISSQWLSCLKSNSIVELCSHTFIRFGMFHDHIRFVQCDKSNHIPSANQRRQWEILKNLWRCLCVFMEGHP